MGARRWTLASVACAVALTYVEMESDADVVFPVGE